MSVTGCCAGGHANESEARICQLHMAAELERQAGALGAMATANSSDKPAATIYRDASRHLRARAAELRREQ